MSTKPPAVGTLGELLRRQGMAVRADIPAPAPSAPEPTAVAPIDLGGVTRIVLRRERKGRGGKTATVVEGLRLPPSGLERIARELKRALGCGASVEGATILVQGDMAARMEPWFLARGVKRVVVGS